MATTTTNLGLTKPTYTETVDIGVINTNMDKIDAAVNTKAPLASPSLTGTPTAPTAAAGTNTTQIATTAFVQSALSTSGGGAPVGDCTNIGITVEDMKLIIKWKDPADVVVDGITTARWIMTKLVRKTGGYPTSENDGVLVVTNTIRNQYQNGYTDTGLTNSTTYYYKLFPITVTGAVNTNAANNISGVPFRYKVYGVTINMTNTNPSTSVTYTDDAVGMSAGSSWDSQPIFKDIRPCVLKDGVVQYYLNPNNFTQKVGGSTADITSGNAGDVMIEIPKFGLSINAEWPAVTVKITDKPNDPSFQYYAFTRATTGDRDNIYIGAYEGYITGGKLRSLSGKTPSTATSGAKTEARANGSGYNQLTFFPLMALQALYLIRFKSLDSQTALGKGYTGGTQLQTTGATNSSGMYYGTTSSTGRVKCLGIEDLWGNAFDMIDGLWIAPDFTIFIAFDADFSDTPPQWQSTGKGATSSTNGYMQSIVGTNLHGFLPSGIGSSATTFFCDYVLYGNSTMLWFGGSFNSDTQAGIFCTQSSVDDTQKSSRLIYT